MDTMNVFGTDAFGMMSLTAYVNKQDYVPGRVGELVNFNEMGISTTHVAIEENDTTLSLIATSKRGEAAPVKTAKKRKLRLIDVPHIKKAVTVYADQVQGVRAFGSESQMQTMESIVHQEMDTVGLEMDLTIENHRLGAFQGIILDADGTTVLVNLFTEFNVTQETEVNFALTTDTTDIAKKCAAIRRTMTTNLKLPHSGKFKIRALCGDTFYDDLKAHANVKAAFDRWNDGQFLRDDHTFSSFHYAGIDFENYQGSDDGSSVAIATNECKLAPVGVPGLWEQRNAPADTKQTVNTIGLPRYVLQDPDGKNNDRAVHWEVQSNPLAFCTRPKVLMKAKRA